MAWGDEVHVSRVTGSMSARREEFALRKRSERVVVGPNAGFTSALSLLTAAASYVLWQRHAEALGKVRWRRLPVVRQFDDLIFGGSGTRLGGSTTKASTKGTRAQQGPVRSRETAGKAAAAAAQARAAASAAPAPRPAAPAAPAPATAAAPRSTGAAPAKPSAAGASKAASKVGTMHARHASAMQARMAMG
jgi:hypothetical protein